MARQEPRIGVVAATRPIADDQIDLLAPVEVDDRIGVRGTDRQGRGDRQRRSPTRKHPSSLYAGARVIARGGAFNGSAVADDVFGRSAAAGANQSTRQSCIRFRCPLAAHAFVRRFRSANIVSALRWQIFSISSLGRSSDSMTAIVARM